MAFLRAGNPSEWTVIQGRGVWLRPPLHNDYGAWAELRTQSRAHLVPWEPAWPRDDLTKSAYRRRIKHYQREARDDLGYAFLAFEAEEDRLIGGLTLSTIRRGVTQSAMLGYWLGLPFVGRGHMTAAVRAALPHAFETLRLHRVEAAVQPGNVRSAAVLRRVGFTEEGLARRYLKINGQWQDHLLFAILAEDWMTGEAQR
ncbi:MAG: GNAT family N-acetyltransferase [Rhizobiales bacterium]|nr:GNAT family N-acetyltransferase [Hyphomicrobiales bacterium]